MCSMEAGNIRAAAEVVVVGVVGEGRLSGETLLETKGGAEGCPQTVS